MNNSKEILYGHGGGDECKTPLYAVIPILEFIPKDAVIWCPFDKPNLSNFVKEISKTNYVEYSHIDYGQDFFNYEPYKWDIIISNPPFTNKKQFFERALSFNKPFALLMTNTWLNDSAPKLLFAEKELQLLMFDKRINFEGMNGENKGKHPTFSSSYYCWNFLPKQIIMKNLLTR